MQKDECFLLGTIAASHGLNGELFLKLDVDNPEKYYDLEMVFVEIDGKLIPFFINSSKPQKGSSLIVHFDDVTNVEKSSRLSGRNVFLPLDQLPRLEGNHFYFHEVVGYTVIDQKLGSIGKIIKVLEYPSQPVFEVEHKGKEVLIPIVDHFILNLNRNEQTITMELPPGLLDVYLS